MKRMACVIALAAGTGIAFGSAGNPAHAAISLAAFARGLQISINAPGGVDGNSTLSLDVNFRGGNIRTIELLIDGSLIKKQSILTREGHGVISFALENMNLTDGVHEILIRAYDLNGNIATSTSKLKVHGDEGNALVKMVNLRRNGMVQGVVPVEATVDSSIKNPYVSFFLDDKFLSLTNYAPYTYNWDSTHVSNGLHRLTVKVIDGETAAELQTLTIPVRVNNPGGFTSIKSTPRIKQTSAAKPGQIKHMPETALPGETESRSAGELSRDSSVVGPHSSSLRLETPHSNAKPASAMQSLLVNSLPILPGIETYRAGTTASAISAPTNPRVMPPTRQATLPAAFRRKPGVFSMALTDDSLTGVESFELNRASVRPRRPGNIAVLPGGHLNTYVAQAAHPTRLQPIARPKLSNFVKAPRNLKTFEVAFDDSLIAFDVAPRIEHGLPLAPFRAIFEHTGGTVEWFNKSKTVHAYNGTHEVEFRVGYSHAKVNNKTVTMESAPTIEKGRAIVPISFVKQALDVNVHFDPATGRLRIESKQ